MVLNFDMIQTIMVAVIVLFVGNVLKSKINFIEKFCIPSPVIGGIVFSAIALIGHMTGKFYFNFDIILKDLFMTAFFTTVGYSASLKLLKNGGIKVFLFLIITVLLIAMQNVIGIALAKLFNLNPLIGLSTASIPMVGGHGTSASFAPLFETMGANGATTVAMAAATFGLVCGSMIGGPIGKKLVDKHNLLNDADSQDDSSDMSAELKTEVSCSGKYLSTAAYQIILAMGIGTIISKALTATGLNFPAYIGAMFGAALIRNIADFSHKYKVYLTEIDVLGNISLSLFLALALMTLKLWELAGLALPMVVMLISQVVLMCLFSYYITFNVMGRDYDAAVIACGNCGFGLGATANAMSNMQAFTTKYRPSPKAFFIVPLVGSLFIDFFNVAIITFFMNLFS